MTYTPNRDLDHTDPAQINCDLKNRWTEDPRIQNQQQNESYFGLSN